MEPHERRRLRGYRLVGAGRPRHDHSRPDGKERHQATDGQAFSRGPESRRQESGEVFTFVHRIKKEISSSPATAARPLASDGSPVRISTICQETSRIAARWSGETCRNGRCVSGRGCSPPCTRSRQFRTASRSSARSCRPSSPLPGKVMEKRTQPVPRLTGIPGQIESVLERKGQVILYGPPGTGKTFWAMRAARDIAAYSKYGTRLRQPQQV